MWSPSEVPSGLPHRTAFHKNMYVSEWRETNTVLSLLNCAVNYTYDICQFKEKFEEENAV